MGCSPGCIAWLTIQRDLQLTRDIGRRQLLEHEWLRFDWEDARIVTLSIGEGFGSWVSERAV
jgi:hypothetical protein